MQLKIYRNGLQYADTYTLVDIVDSFISLRWVRCYYEPGSFELKLNYYPGILKKFKKDDIIALREDEVCYIETIQKTTDNDSGELVLKGRSLSNWLARRIIKYTIDYKNTTAETIMMIAISQNAYYGIEDRGIPYLYGMHNNIPLKNIDYQNTYGNLIKEFTSLAKESDVGYRTIYDLENNNFKFECYQGKDCTRSQSVNTKIVFSDEEVDSVNYTTTNKDVGNMAYVGGEGEGVDRKVIEINNAKKGFDRYEIFIDARDLQSEYYDGSTKKTLTEAEYVAKLEQRGKEKLEATKVKDVYKVKLRTMGKNQYKYLEDYDLGYLVTFRDRDINEFVDLRLTKITEFYEGDQCKIDITLGDDILTGSIVF